MRINTAVLFVPKDPFFSPLPHRLPSDPAKPGDSDAAYHNKYSKSLTAYYEGVAAFTRTILRRRSILLAIPFR